MPEISKIKLILNQEEQTLDIKDSELRDSLKILLGDQEEDDNQGDE